MSGPFKLHQLLLKRTKYCLVQVLPAPHRKLPAVRLYQTIPGMNMESVKTSSREVISNEFATPWAHRCRAPWCTPPMCYMWKILRLKKHELVVHVQGHTGDSSSCKCTVWGKAMPKQSFLNDHMNKHFATKPHGCRKCGQSFASKSTFIIMIRFVDWLNIKQNAKLVTRYSKASNILENTKRLSMDHQINTNVGILMPSVVAYSNTKIMFIGSLRRRLLVEQIKVWDWISNFKPHIMDAITYPCWDYN